MLLDKRKKFRNTEITNNGEKRIVRRKDPLMKCEKIVAGDSLNRFRIPVYRPMQRVLAVNNLFECPAGHNLRTVLSAGDLRQRAGFFLRKVFFGKDRIPEQIRDEFESNVAILLQRCSGDDDPLERRIRLEMSAGELNRPRNFP